MPCYSNALTVLNVLRTDLDTNRDTFHFIFSKLPARRVVAVVQLNSYSRSFQLIGKFICLFKYAFLVESNRNYYDLDRCNSRRQSQTVVITVRHYYRTDKSRCNAPRRLVRVLEFILLICELYVESPCKTITKVV